MSIRFGVEGSHSDYVIPIAIINLYDEKGSSNYQTMYIRMGGTFSTAIRAAYEDAQGIMGTPFQADQTTSDKLKTVGTGFLSGLQAQIVKGALGATGTALSAGISGRQQIEFLSRVFLSNFQQVVYRGPSFRMFTLPFTMKPTSKTEAESMKKIVALLKFASVPKLGAINIFDAVRQFGGDSEGLFGGSVNAIERASALSAQLKDKTPEQIQNDTNLSAAQAEFAKLDFENRDFVSEEETRDFNVAPESPITFGYPDICDFQLALYQSSEGILKKVFASKKCVIESVVADYGSSNKMTFFEDGFFPCEINLTINLKELEFQTTKTIADYITHEDQYTII